MKKIITVLAIPAMALALGGCTDARASLKDASTAVVKVGNVSVTKGEIYNIMRSYAGGSQIMTDAQKVITSNEVEVTDEMRESAQSSLQMYKLYYGTQFEEYLASSNLTEDEYVEQFLIPGLQADELPAKYISENYDELVTRYNPVRTTVLEFTELEGAQAALSALKDGSLSPAEAAAENGSSSSGEPEIVTLETTDYDSLALALIRSLKPDEGWNLVTSQAGDTIYVIRVEETDEEALKEEITDALAGISAVKDDATKYFFKKYGFHVYDIDLYNSLAADNPQILVQDVPISAQ